MQRLILPLLLPLWLGAVPVPLTVHLSSAQPARARTWLEAQVARASQLHAGAGARFEVRRLLSFAAPGPQITTVRGRNALAAQMDRSRTVHVFVVDRLANKDGPGWIGGVHWRHHGRHFVIVSRGEALPDTLAHELGHYFGLRHTRAADNLMTSPGRVPGAQLSPAQLRRVRARLRPWARRRAKGRPVRGGSR